MIHPLWRFLLLITVLMSGCSRALWIKPQVPTGGLNSRFAEAHPAYSSDGRYLVFASDRRGQRNIYLFDLQQRRLVSLPNLNHRDSSQDQPSMSADGRYIAYISNERGKTDVMVYDRQRQRSELLTVNVKGSVRHPTISGDGSQIAFEASQLGQWNIVIIDRN